MVKVSHMKYAALITLSLIITGCAGTLVDAPSLNKRAFEISLAEMRAQTSNSDKAISDSIVLVDETPISASLSLLSSDDRMLWDRHKKADSDFAAQSNIARATARKANGQGFGSENWSAAHVALSRLDRTRSPSLAALSAIDARVFDLLDNSVSGQDDDSDFTALLQIQKRMEFDVTTQTKFIDDVANSLAKQ